MAARSEKAIHFSFAVVSYGSVVQVVLLILGAVFWWSNSDEQNQTKNTLITGMACIIMASYGITIGCAMRPVIRSTFIVYALWQIAASATVLAVLKSISDGTESCKLPIGEGMAAVSTSSACPGLVATAETVSAARELCESAASAGRCEWTDRCTVRDEDQCEQATPSGICIYRPAENSGCGVNENHPDASDTGRLHGSCAATPECNFADGLTSVGHVFLCSAGMTLLAVCYILQDSRYPTPISLNVRHQQSMWTVAMQLSLDPQTTKDHELFKETGQVSGP